MRESQDNSLMGRVKSKAMGFWARFSDSEESQIDYKQDELNAQDDSRPHSRREAEAKVKRQGEHKEFAHPNDRPNFEAPGSYPPSHRHMTEDKGPQGT